MLNRSLVILLAVACGIAVADLYYCQPLLLEMGRSMGVSPQRIGLVATLPQLGYGAGMLLFVPLGDLLERRRLVVTLLLLVTVALAAVASARSYLWLAMASLAVGLTTVVAQILIPMAAQLAGPRDRGKVIGILYTGLLLGILLARTISGISLSAVMSANRAPSSLRVSVALMELKFSPRPALAKSVSL